MESKSTVSRDRKFSQYYFANTPIEVEDVLGLRLDPDVVEEANGHTSGAEFHEMSSNSVFFKQLFSCAITCP